MCGIFGFSGFQDPTLLKRMGHSLFHRGPDSEGMFSADQLNMGMRRLSIIDLESGEQPIFNEDNTIAVVFNGEIYNYIELREELISKGHHFITRTDTEVIVHAYEEWGTACLTRFNGMFALALYNKRTKQLLIARDRSGQKPLYYYYKNGKFLFASEIKALLMADFIPREVNHNAIDAYLGLRYVPEPSTMFKDIFTLPSAHFLILNKDGDLKIERYYEIKLIHDSNYLSSSYSLEAVESKLQEAVRLVMRSDVPVGAYLSGGIDSSLLVALMCQHNERINTYSIGFNSAIDETAEARQTAQLLGTHHQETHCTPEDLKLLPKIIYQMDRPVGDALIIAFHKLAELASKDLKVVISGEGADEIFAGYPFHKLMQMMHSYHQLMPAFIHNNISVPTLRKVPDQLLNLFFKFPAQLGKQGKQIFLDFLTGFRNNSLFSNYMALKTLWRYEARQDLYSSAFKNLASHNWIPQERDNKGHYLDRLLKIQWDEWLQDCTIIRQDKNSMTHSLEIRLPFLDHELIDLSFKINPKLKATWFKDKIIERKLAKKILPAEITQRPKKPFFFPMDYFFENKEFTNLVNLTLNEEQIKKRGYFDSTYIKNLLQKMQTREFIYLKQVTSLVILELWHMIFIDGEQPAL